MDRKRNITVCVSWPYANNNLHIGYIASSLSGDILARYHRALGDNVAMISGTDSHGTKPSIKARQQGCTPKDIVDKYDANFREALKKFEFSFDDFGITYDEFHKNEAKKIFKKLYDNGYLYEKVNSRPFCPHCNKFVNDTEIEIVCPVCGRTTKADNCDCGYVPNEADLVGAKCLVCGTKTEQRENKVLVFKLTAFKDFLQKHLDDNKKYWRANSINETQKYLDDLRDRDFSRDLDWGVEIPLPGYEGKVVWVWWEALLGYITGTMKYCARTGQKFEDYWKTTSATDKRIYLCHAKDNIVFHSMFLPAMLKGLNDNWFIPDRMVSAEYLLINDQKISKSNTKENVEALWWANEYNTDTLRFYFCVNGPEKKDINFTSDLYKVCHNEIVNKLGNLVNRTLKYKGLEELPQAEVDAEILKKIKEAYTQIGTEIENTEFKKAGSLLLDLVMEGNKYFDEQKPWVQLKEDKAGFDKTIATCALLIANLGNLAEPFMPTTARTIRELFGTGKAEWKPITTYGKVDLSKVTMLFTRI